MAAYVAAEWSNLFVASAGAAAALAGLVFVAVSINLAQILRYPGLPERALQTLLLLLGVLVVSVLGLAPGQGRRALGTELLITGMVLVLVVGVLLRRGLTLDPRPGHEPVTWVAGRIAVLVPATVPVVVGGASLLAGSGGGLYWIFAGIIGAFIGGVTNAWVLLVEIQR